jgi:glycosyltransferase involved in cell wall biosynthesis
MTVVSRRLPLQCLLAAPNEWVPAIGRAGDEAGPFDVTIVLLSRLHPWAGRSLQGRTILDAVDSLRRNAEERSRAAGPLSRWLWRREAARMTRLELDAAREYDVVTVVSEEESADFGDAIAVPMGVDVLPEWGGERSFEFGFWGRLPYFANADAVNWLLRDIWPRIRALRPSATLVIGGASASRALRRHARIAGVTLVSPFDDIKTFARSIGVALMPLRFGTGQSNKVVEAAEAGCAIAGTTVAFRGLTSLAAVASVEDSADGLARAAVELLDGDRRQRMASELRAVVERDHARSTVLERLRRVAGLEVEE